MPFRKIILAAFFAAFAAAAWADGEILRIMTETDRTRLANYETIRAEAIEEAHKGGAPEDIAHLEEMLSAPHLSFAGFDLTGDWQCRTTKAGGLVPLVTYPWFRCRVTDDGSGWRLEKITGSQRTEGRFFTDSDSRQTYLGTFYVAGGTRHPYGEDPQSDQAVYAFRTGERSWLIEFPAPAFESKLDIMEFRR